MGYSKLLIKGEIEVVTGLHIGSSNSYSAIGAVDSPVVEDSVTGNPIIQEDLKRKCELYYKKLLKCFI